LTDKKRRAGQLGGLTTFLRAGDDDESRHIEMQRRGSMGGRPREVFTYEEITQRSESQPINKNNRRRNRQLNSELTAKEIISLNQLNALERRAGRRESVPTY